MLGELLLRDFITSDIEAKNLQLIYQYGEGLKEVQQLFSRDRHQSMAGKFYAREGPPLFVNMPPVSGALFWLRGLIERIEEPMLKLKQTMRLMLDAEEAKEGEGGEGAVPSAPANPPPYTGAQPPFQPGKDISNCIIDKKYFQGSVTYYYSDPVYQS